MKRMSKRNLARIVAFLTAGLLVVCLFTIGAVVKAKEYERKTEAMYQKNLAAAGEYLSDIDTVLLKGLFSESAANQSSMCADLWRDAYEAKNAIASLPLSDLDMESCYSFLSKVAEYARATEKQIASGNRISAQAHANFLSIRRKISSLSDGFEKLQKFYMGTGEKISGGIDFSFAVPRTISSSHATSQSLNTLNKNLSDAPKLLYDGPYSDVVNEKTPRMLDGLDKIDLKKATVTAERFLKNEDGTLKMSGSKKGNLPCYCFKKGNAYAEISVYGGKVVTFTALSSPSKTAFDESEGLSICESYLRKAGYKEMKCDYYEIGNHFLVANYHAVEQGVNCYTDLIKVKLNLESGKVCGFDASSYLTNHQSRSFAFAISQKQARAAVSSYLKIKDVKEALIPTQSEKEALCYEFRCLTPEGEELLVFINAETGKEQDILILQISDAGVLTK